MEVINLDLEKDNHKNINIDTSSNIKTNQLNITKQNNYDLPSSNSHIGIDLLINKSKTSDTIDEFKSSNPVPKNDSIENINIKLDDIGMTNNNEFSLPSLSPPITPTPNNFSFDSKQENLNNVSSSIDLSNNNSNNDNIDLNLDDLFKDTNDNSTQNNNNPTILITMDNKITPIGISKILVIIPVAPTKKETSTSLELTSLYKIYFSFQ